VLQRFADGGLVPGVSGFWIVRYTEVIHFDGLSPLLILTGQSYLELRQMA
jgi:hypothetical protein